MSTAQTITGLKQAYEQAQAAHIRKSSEADRIIAKAKKEYSAALLQAESIRSASQENIERAVVAIETETFRATSQEWVDASLTRYNEVFNGKRPTTKSPAVQTASTRTPAVKAAPVKKTTTAKTTATQRSVTGRDDVTNGVRPPLKDAIRLILAKKTLHTREIIDELQNRNWAPKSGSIKAYVSNVLSTYSNVEKLKEGAIFESIKTGKGRGYYRVRIGAAPINAETRKRFGGDYTPSTTATKAAPAPRASNVKQASSKTTAKSDVGRGCSVCGTPGHNTRSHDAFVANGGKVAKAAPAKTATAKTATAKAAPKRPDERGCSICGVVGHNKRGHAKYLAAQANGASGKTASKTTTKKGPTVKDSTVRHAVGKTNGTAAHVKPGKGQQKCGECGALGHNKKGHAAFVAKSNSNGKEPSSRASHKSAPAQASASAPEVVAPSNVDDVVALERAKVSSSSPVTDSDFAAVDAGM